jgi:hypothetical protein
MEINSARSAIQFDATGISFMHYITYLPHPLIFRRKQQCSTCLEQKKRKYLGGQTTKTQKRNWGQ